MDGWSRGRLDGNNINNKTAWVELLLIRSAGGLSGERTPWDGLAARLNNVESNDVSCR